MQTTAEKLGWIVKVLGKKQVTVLFSVNCTLSSRQISFKC